MTEPFAVGTAYFYLLCVLELIILLLYIDSKQPFHAVFSTAIFFSILYFLGNYNIFQEIWINLSLSMLLTSVYLFCGFIISGIYWHYKVNTIKDQLINLKISFLEKNGIPINPENYQSIDFTIDDEHLKDSWLRELKNIFGLPINLNNEFVLDKILPDLEESENVIITVIFFWPAFFWGGIIYLALVKPFRKFIKYVLVNTMYPNAFKEILKNGKNHV